MATGSNPKAHFDETQIPTFRKALRTWFLKAQRDLPWRQSPTLYKTVVSEFMLQQTQVVTVVPYFERWLRLFPDFKSLASADEAAVLKAWEGLGYYSRARNLHSLAKQIDQETLIPQTPEGWLKYKGIGPYTAAAITSIAFETPVAVVDGNLIRILTRLTEDPTEFKDNNTAMRVLGPLAQALLDPKHPGDHNQSMMELGATVCTKHNPLCLVCPVRSFCKSGRAGSAQLYPKLKRKLTILKEVDRAWVVHKGKLLLHCAPSRSVRLKGMYELPTLGAWVPPSVLANKTLLLKKSRGISNERICERVFEITPTQTIVKSTQGIQDLCWLEISKLNTITLSGPHRRWIDQLLERSTNSLKKP
ncbi:MAG: hypothetical protein B7X06_00610 [Verrucomicrobia bacterium 21-51-4]|nr:MAG: hypothetical protein B7X06_00610 [Verrucomicrobia bacterium 21-51-4]